MPKLSVIVPVYNTEKYLRECIDSILAQNYVDFELILVNDGSTDNSGIICDEYAKKDARVCVVHQKNGGITVARKTGVQHATGEYVTFVDSDDWIAQETYAAMLDDQYDAAPDIIIYGMLTETDYGTLPGKKIIKAGLYNKQRMQTELYPIMLFDFAHCMPAITPSLCNKLFRRKLLAHVIKRVNDTITYGEDALCTYACLLDADWIYVSEKELYHYRSHRESVSSGYSACLLEKFSLLISEMQRQFQTRTYDMEKQLYGYTAKHSLECIRSVILYYKEASYIAKRTAITSFLSEHMIQQSISYAISNLTHFRTRIKLFLSQRKCIEALYVGFLVRNYLLIRKKEQL